MHGPTPDIEDLNYVSASEELGVYNYRPPQKGARSVPVSMIYYLAKMVRSAFRTGQGPHWKSLRGSKVLFGLASLNQLSAVAPIIENLEGAKVLSLGKAVDGARFPELGAYLAGIRHFRTLLKLRHNATGYKLIGYEHHFDRYLLTYGYFQSALRVLRRLDPRLVLVSNDHNMEPRTLVHAATTIGIRTAFVQHASATRGFPPLTFDLAFLDGEDAAHKYDQPSPHRPRVFLTGIAKADGARRRLRKRTELKRIGICINELDPLPEVLAFIRDLKEYRPDLELVLRPHPRDTRNWDAADKQVVMSDARSEASFDFLDHVDAIVTGPSNIALEAALAGVRSAFKDFGGLELDPYGFLENGLCKQVSTAAEAVEQLDPAHSGNRFATVLKRYCATIDTPFDGKSAELIRQLIMEETGDGIDTSRWRKRSDFKHIDVYELHPG